MNYYYLTAKCGGTRRAAQGKISSPNYPGSYESNMDCEYRIIAGPNKQVILKFETVSLKRRYPGNRIVGDVVNNETSDDSLTIFNVDPLNKTSNVYLCVSEYTRGSSKYSYILNTFVEVSDSKLDIVAIFEM